MVVTRLRLGAHSGAGATRGGIIVGADCGRARGAARAGECSGLGSGIALDHVRGIVSAGGFCALSDGAPNYRG